MGSESRKESQIVRQHDLLAGWNLTAQAETDALTAKATWTVRDQLEANSKLLPLE